VLNNFKKKHKLYLILYYKIKNINQFYLSKYNNIMNFIILLTAIGILTLYKIYINSNKYISSNLILENVYLHILLGLILSGLTALSIDNCTSINNKINNYKIIIGTFILSLLSLFIIFSAGNNKGLQYGGFIVFMLSIGILLHPYITLLKYNGKGTSIFLSLICMIGFLSLIAYKLPNLFLGWGAYLIIGLLSLIVIEVFDLIIGNSTGRINRNKIYGWIGILLFSGFILYDSQRLLEQAKAGEMISTYYKTNNINYPALSLSIYLDIINLFSSLTNVNI
jgi:FtsH-binding integral membrane protein